MTEQDKAKKKEKINNNLKEIFYYFSDINEYYEHNCQKDDYIRMTIDLLREAIYHRIKKKEKHYHVAYIKQNKFLSPQQKMNVTPKITEMIPKSGKVKIYQKPKIRTQQEVYEMNQKKTLKNIKENEKFKDRNREDHIIQQSSKYLKPKQQHHYQKSKDKNLIKNKAENINQVKSVTFANHYTSNDEIPSQLKIQSNYQTMNQFIPTQVKLPAKASRYQAQSRIKDLVDRDKRNKKLEDLIAEQNQKIQKLSQRQSKLLSKQQIQKQRTSLIRQNIKTLLQEAQSSLESSLQKEIIAKRTQKRNSLMEIDEYKTRFNQKLKSIPKLVLSQHNLTFTDSSLSHSQQSQDLY